MVGVERLADRLVQEIARADGAVDEAVLTLADFLIVLREIDYQPGEGTLPKPEFERIIHSFLSELAGKLEEEIEEHRGRLSEDVMAFWERVVERCRG